MWVFNERGEARRFQCIGNRPDATELFTIRRIGVKAEDLLFASSGGGGVRDCSFFFKGVV